MGWQLCRQLWKYPLRGCYYLQTHHARLVAEFLVEQFDNLKQCCTYIVRTLVTLIDVILSITRDFSWQVYLVYFEHPKGLNVKKLTLK